MSKPIECCAVVLRGHTMGYYDTSEEAASDHPESDARLVHLREVVTCGECVHAQRGYPAETHVACTIDPQRFPPRAKTWFCGDAKSAASADGERA